MTTKAQAERIHAKRRLLERHGIQANRALLERHGIQANRALLDTITQAIQAGRSTPVERQSLRVTKHRVEVEGKQLLVIYDRKRKTVVTVLPEETP